MIEPHMRVREIYLYLKCLEEQGIFIERKRICIHPDTFSCNQSRTYYDTRKEYPYSSIPKHLFFKESKGQERFFLIVVDDSKLVDLSTLRNRLGCSKLRIASNEELEKTLGTVPGAISLLNLVNDKDREVNVIIDEDLNNNLFLPFHPGVSNLSVFLRFDEIERFLISLKSNYQITSVHAKSQVKRIEELPQINIPKALVYGNQ